MARAQGIDVSRYQSTTPSLEGLDFLIARASIGLLADPVYDTHIANAKAAGLHTGAYHFNWSGSTPEEQARFFVQAAGKVDWYFLDVEGSRAFTKAETEAFIAEVIRLVGHCGLYMSEAAYRWHVGQSYDWVANWSDEPDDRYEFWQYRGSPLDLNKFKGTRADLDLFVASQEHSLSKLPVELEELRTIRIPAGTRVYNLNGNVERQLASAQTRQALHRVVIDDRKYWVVRLPQSELMLVRAGDVDTEVVPVVDPEVLARAVAERDAAVAALAPLNDQLAANLADMAAQAAENSAVAAELRAQADRLIS